MSFIISFIHYIIIVLLRNTLCKYFIRK